MAYRILLFLIVFLVAVSVPINAQADYNTIIEDGLVENVVGDTGSHLLYILYDDQVIEGHEASISTVSFLNTSQDDDIRLELISEDGKTINMSSFVADDNDENETYYMVSWNVSPENDTTYSLQLSINDDEVYQRDTAISVIERSVVDRQVSEKNVPLFTNDTESETVEQVRELLLENGFEYSPLEIETMIETAQDKLSTRKKIKHRTVSYDDNTTETTTSTYISVKAGGGDVSDVKVIEVIPKSVAPSADNLSFEHLTPVILEKDPVIMWHVDDPGEDNTVSYAVDRNASATGNTILLATESESSSSGSGLKTLFAILLIPVVAGLIIYFNKYAPEAKR